MKFPKPARVGDAKAATKVDAAGPALLRGRRTGGGYRLAFDVDGTKTMAFFGKYIEVTPHSRIVWTKHEREAPCPG